MTLFERMRALPEDCRAALRRASAWAVLAALLDAACGVLSRRPSGLRKTIK
ncbi:hypothetical protein NB836_033835, partial [Pseudomonas aeruginosa]|uniref:hypothetical protein n=1 Tax=Pseudomonas aeruginosa TaxID=287 RepID=UPI0023B081AD